MTTVESKTAVLIADAPFPSSTGLSFVPCVREADFEAVRSIRNECREYMTRDRRPISKRAQARWWRALPPDVIVLLVLVEGEAAGFGMVRCESDGDWLTGGLLPQYRGLGIGNTLFRELISLCKRPRLEVLKANPRALRLYVSLGFKTVSETATTLTMELAW